ncbi:MAG: glycosyltransferase family 4 protein, partial [Candidatus Acidiferrales bacterium]
RRINQEKLDLFFFPSVYSYVPLLGGLPKIVTVHDIIYELCPELIFPTLRSRLYWRAKVKMACAQARLILTVSEYSRRCLTEHMAIAPERLRVVNEASDPVFRQLEHPEGTSLMARWGLSSETRFLTYVGGFSPHKNLGLLVDVFRELQSQPRFDDVRLLLVGDYERDAFYSCYEQIEEQVRRAGLHERVIFCGYLSDEDLVILLNLAKALVLPSVSEGFGLPAVEAAACGTPAVVTTESPLPELLRAGAIGVEPNDRAGLRHALSTILSDAERHQKMCTAARAAAAQLSWANSARQLLNVFEEVCEPSGTSA